MNHRNESQKHILTAVLIAAMLVIGAVIITPQAQAMTVPSGTDVYVYYGLGSPVFSDDPAVAKPIGIGPLANGGENLGVQIGYNPFSGPVDVMLGIQAPGIDLTTIFLLSGDGALQPATVTSRGLEPIWKPNTSAALNIKPFGEFPMSLLPEGLYVFYLAVTPAYSLNNYTIWATTAASLPPMVFIEGGCFQMGDIWGDGQPDERPAHQVCVGNYFIDQFEVRQIAFQGFMWYNPSSLPGSYYPVTDVSWSEADAFCRSIGRRLPTEAEWEYAARSGQLNQQWAGADDAYSLYDFAWYTLSATSLNLTGQKLPNAFGLYDMSGNVWEWVSDWYDAGYYSASPVNDPQGPAAGQYRIVRGGSWSSPAASLRSANRSAYSPEVKIDSIGFRCASTP